MSTFLIEERPLLIPPTLAMRIGLNEAIFVQQLQFWLDVFKRKRDKAHFREGRWWVWNTHKDWGENFPFWSERTLRRTIHSVEEPAPGDGDLIARGPLVISSRFHDNPFNQTKWYSIDYAELERVMGVAQKLADARALIEANCDDDDSLEDTNRPNWPLLHAANLATSLTETTDRDHVTEKANGVEIAAAIMAAETPQRRSESSSTSAERRLNVAAALKNYHCRRPNASDLRLISKRCRVWREMGMTVTQEHLLQAAEDGLEYVAARPAEYPGGVPKGLVVYEKALEIIVRRANPHVPIYGGEAATR